MSIKLFNKWDCGEAVVVEPGLINYISLQPLIVPKTGATYAGKRFHKSKVNIVERLINKIMVTGHKGKKHFQSSGRNTGKKLNAMNAVKDAFIIIEEKLGTNPIVVFVKALETAAPREEIITIEYGGARYPQAVEVAPQRRIDYVLRLMTQGARRASFNKKKSLPQALAEEIMWAYNEDVKSVAISKKNELERQADSSR